MGKFQSIFGSGRWSKASDYVFVIVVILGFIYELNGCRNQNSSVVDNTPEQKIEHPETLH